MHWACTRTDIGDVQEQHFVKDLISNCCFTPILLFHRKCVYMLSPKIHSDVGDKWSVLSMDQIHQCNKDAVNVKV